MGMTQIFDDDAQAIPVTVIKAGPCHVAQIKTAATDGYDAIQIAYRELPTNRATKPAGYDGPWIQFTPDTAAALTRDYQADPLTGTPVEWQIECLEPKRPQRAAKLPISS